MSVLRCTLKPFKSKHQPHIKNVIKHKCLAQIDLAYQKQASSQHSIKLILYCFVLLSKEICKAVSFAKQFYETGPWSKFIETLNSQFYAYYCAISIL